MKKNMLFILAEGSHDTAFIYRILRANGFKLFNEKIKDFPEPMDNLLQKDILDISIPEVNIQTASRRFLPSYVMQLNNNFVFLYSFKGDSDADSRISLIKTITIFNVVDEDDLAISASPDTSFSILYFFDADDKGTDARMAQVKGELMKAFPEFDFDKNYEASTFHTINDIPIGAFIFREEDKDQGMLEDVLLPLMKEDNEDIFDAAEKFLGINHTCKLFSGKITYIDEEKKQIKKVNGKKYFHRKSLIGTVGQLQKSGSSNVVCISQADFLTDEKILANNTCQKIFDLINSIMI